MELRDNYRLQAEHAKQYFLSYDQQALVKKCSLRQDEQWLYAVMLGRTYRIHRKTGDLFCLEGQVWQDANTHAEVMTLLDLICDSREDRHPAGRLKNMSDFGHQFHQELTERNPAALRYQENPQGLRKACLALGGIPMEVGDIAYRIPLFEDLAIVLQFWLGDEEFAPSLRYLWDENALQYLKYETMYFAVDLLQRRLLEAMK